mmetsp:Transcript_8890/g.16280  ORF Transcript_8890/g.16280 Transcript_8890/m.16280 type:complete len:100 (-) Transcript_8890:259-558(-)
MIQLQSNVLRFYIRDVDSHPVFLLVLSNLKLGEVDLALWGCLYPRGRVMGVGISSQKGSPSSRPSHQTYDQRRGKIDHYDEGQGAWSAAQQDWSMYGLL